MSSNSDASKAGISGFVISKLTYPFNLAISSLPPTITGMIPNYEEIRSSRTRAVTKKDKDASTDCLPFFVQEISPKITFMSASREAENVSSIDHLGKFSPEGRPLCVMLCWLMAELTGIKNYAKFYINNGFDLIVVRLTVLDVLLPSRIEDTIQNELIPVLIRVKHDRTVIHAFSVGGYLCATFLKNIEHDPTGMYAKFIDTVQCTVWDSVVDFKYAPKGVSAAMFPSSPLLQNLFLKYTEVHMKIFYNYCTKYWEIGNYYAYHKPIQVPALCFYSDQDSMSPPEMNVGLMRSWETFGVPCRSKIFKGSAHVLHMRMYPTEYQSSLKEFLEENNMINWR